MTIEDVSFAPATPLTVKAGATVTWTNAGPAAHTTTSDAGVWDSGTLSAPGGGYGATAGGTYRVKFTTPGTYPYRCAIHPPASYPGSAGGVAPGWRTVEAMQCGE